MRCGSGLLYRGQQDVRLVRVARPREDDTIDTLRLKVATAKSSSVGAR